MKTERQKVRTAIHKKAYQMKQYLHRYDISRIWIEFSALCTQKRYQEKRASAKDPINGNRFIINA